jgi:pyruvate-formate lyase-activating enzyme
MSCVTQYELLGFHTMGFFKYEKLGMPNPLADTKALEPSVKQRLQQYVNDRMC